MSLAHLAVAVDNLENAAKLYTALGFVVGPVEEVAQQSVRLRKAVRDGLCVELLEPLIPNSGSVGKFLSKKGPGLHHVALRSTDLRGDLLRLSETGIATLPGYPSVGSEGSTVAFLDPKTTNGVLIELVEEGCDHP